MTDLATQWLDLHAQGRDYVRRLLATERNRWRDAQEGCRVGPHQLMVMERADAFEIARALLLGQSSSPLSPSPDTHRTPSSPPSNDTSTSSGGTASRPIVAVPHDAHRIPPRGISSAQAPHTVTSGVDTLSSVVAAIECGEVRS